MSATFGPPSRLPSIIERWRNGDDLRSLPRTSLWRYRHKALALGFDLTKPYRVSEAADGRYTLAAALSLFHGVPPSNPTAS